MKGFHKLNRHPEFEKDLKKLLKKFPSLNEDLESFIKTQLLLFHKHQIDNNGIFLLSGLGITTPKIYKAKKFACKSLKGRGASSGIRIIYAYHPEEDCIEFIEIYYKADQAIESRDRIKNLYDG
jgi:mRNA-degrading endonuclease RelE of RelBE toxin-antitoxin system